MKSINRKFLLVVLVAIQLLNTAAAQESWTFEKEKDGIKVFTRPSPESPFAEFRATMQLNQPVHALVAVLQDIENMPQWAFNVSHSGFIKEPTATEQFFYTEVSLPFPFANRDAVYRNNYYWYNDSSLLIVDIQMLPAYMEEKENLVRIPLGKGSWRVKVLDDKTLEVTFQMLVDPGGNVPAWLANMFIDDTPVYTLSHLREVIVKEEYQNRKFDFLE